MNREQAKVNLERGFRLTHYLLGSDAYFWRVGGNVITSHGTEIPCDKFWESCDSYGMKEGWKNWSMHSPDESGGDAEYGPITMSHCVRCGKTFTHFGM